MRIIFNADDFGASTSINAAVIQAHQDGVLTSASLTVTGGAVKDAVALAHAYPTLAVGLHLVVIGGRSCLAPAQIPHLVDRQGYFSADPVRAGVRYFFSRAAQRELAQELDAQFAFFASTGLPLAHVNGHLHMHMHPTVFQLILPLAQQYGASGIRLPRDDLRISLGYDRWDWGRKTADAAVFGLLCGWGARHLVRCKLKTTDRVYGLLQTGRMEEMYVIRLLQGLDAATAELYFHPTLAPLADPLGPNQGDLAALLSPRVRQIISARGIEMTSYPAL